jgi:hypothetical protein
MTTRKIIAAFLVFLCVPPAWGGTAPLGSVTLSTESAVRDTKLAPGSTIYSGDVISVADNGVTRVVFHGGAQAEILSQSSVQISEEEGSAQLVVQRGQASFRTSGGSVLSARVADATVRALNAVQTFAVVQSLSETRAMVSAQKGSLLLTTAQDGKSYTLLEGQAADLVASDDPQQGQTPDPAGKSQVPTIRKKPVLWTVIIVGAGAGVAAYLLSRREPKTAPTNLVISPSSF